MTNPLIAKWEELYGKKEEPKPQKTHTEELKELRDTSTISVTTSNNPYGVTKANPMLSLTSYDYDSGKDSFLQTAEKIKNKNAKVTSVTLNRDAGLFITGPTTITFEVQVWDTP